MSSYGYLDPVRARTVSGWACDRADPARILTVEVVINRSRAGQTKANMLRRDLTEAGIGNGRHGFLFPIPEEIEEVRSVEAYVAGHPEPLGPPAQNAIDAGSNRPLPAEWRSADGTYAFPSFFILGAAKSGTTSLHHYLQQCPGVLMSDPKEPYFFEDEYEWGAAFYFNRYFSAWNGERVVGEARHRNLYLPWVAERIHNHNPAAHLVVILRNPVERAISHWWHWVVPQFEKLPLKEALMADLRRIETAPQLPVQEQIARYRAVLAEGRDGPFRTYWCESGFRTYLDSGYYLEQIERYVRLFGRERLHVMLLDDLIAAPQSTMAELLKFLDVDPRYAELIEYDVCNRSLDGMLEHVDEDVLAWLDEHFAPHNRRLASFLGRSLGCWDDAFRGRTPGGSPAASRRLDPASSSLATGRL